MLRTALCRVSLPLLRGPAAVAAPAAATLSYGWGSFSRYDCSKLPRIATNSFLHSSAVTLTNENDTIPSTTTATAGMREVCCNFNQNWAVGGG